MWSNYHTHTTYCDGKNTPLEIVSHSQELASLGFSSHAPLPFDCRWCIGPDKLESYRTDIDHLKHQGNSSEVYTGLEVDFIPGITGPADFSERLDYTIGSVHFVERFPDGSHWEIDGSHQLFLKGLHQIFNNDIKEAVTRYFELICEMVGSSCPTIVGHLDKIKIQNSNNKFFSESDPWYTACVIETLDHLASAGVIVEVNTRGLYQNKSATPYPSPWILERLYQKNIPVTISSDAHHIDDLTCGFSSMAKLLHSIGFKEVAVLLEGKWQFKKFNADGIIL